MIKGRACSCGARYPLQPRLLDALTTRQFVVPSLHREDLQVNRPLKWPQLVLRRS